MHVRTNDGGRHIHGFDVLIVGAGPAGATAARVLAETGMRALVVEAKRLPRYKICSGLVLERAQQFLEQSFGLPPQEVFCAPNRLKGVRLCLGGDSLLDLPQENRPPWNVWRAAFDHWLVRQSRAEVLDGHRLVGCTLLDNAVRAVVRKPDRSLMQVEASFLIGADGASSHIRELLYPSASADVNRIIASQKYCIGTIDLDRDYFYMFFNPSLKSFYAWVNFKDEYLVHGVSAPLGTSINAYFDDFREYLEKSFGLKIQKTVRKAGCTATDMGIKGSFLLGKGQVLLAGEAAGFMNMFGEGISSATSTGCKAATAITEARSLGRDALPIYADLAEGEKAYTTNSWKLAEALLGGEPPKKTK